MKLSVVRPNPTVGAGDLKADGSVPLTADWDAGSFEIRAATFESDITTGTAPLVVASTTKVTNLNADKLDDQEGSYYLDSANFTGTNWTDLTDGGVTTLHSHTGGSGDLKADGTVPLTANWDVGSYKITANQLESDVATGTAPLVVTSTTKVTNLNADLLDDQTGSYYLDINNHTGALNGVNDFRLTLTTGVPVTTSDVTSASTIYCCPYKGNRISLYDGSTKWNTRTSAQFSLALSALTANRPYDVFCYDNAGTPTLEFLAWTSDTVRATALVYQDGILVKSGATTRRYMGTFWTTSTTQTQDAVAGRHLWNYYNRVKKDMRVLEGTNTWTYTTATIRQARATTSNQLDFVIGVQEDSVRANVAITTTNTSASVGRTVGIGLDSTSAFAAAMVAQGTEGSAGSRGGTSAYFDSTIAIGRHTLVWLEYSVATGTTTWYGDNGGTLAFQAGIVGSILC